MKKYLLLPVFLLNVYISNSQEMVDPYHHPEQVNPLKIETVDFSYLSSQNEYKKSIDKLGYKVEEIFLKGKKSAPSNEDGIILTPDFIAVIDGATSKSAFSMEGKTSGRLSMELVLEAINEFPKDIDATQAVRLITKKLHDFYINNNLLTSVNDNPAARLTSNGVIYSISRKELWQIGDCQALINGHHYNNNKEIDDIMADARSAYDEVALLQGETLESLRTKDPGRDFILPFLKIQGVLQNYHGHPYGFPVMDGFEIDINQVIVVPIEADEIVLASDGYPNLFNTLKESEFFLKKVINEDPMLIRLYKSTKGVQKGQDSFDDRAYVRVRFK